MIKSILEDKLIKPKEKTEQIAAALSNGNLSISDLQTYATAAKDPAKATCIEAVEYVAAKQPGIVDENFFRFALSCLSSKAPRVKWESAKVIGHSAGHFPAHIPEAITALQNNSMDTGTVVRWSAAFALSEILKQYHSKYPSLKNTIEKLAEQEEKNSIKKIYLAALKISKA